MKIGLISCVKTKLNYPAPAKDLYISDLFKKSLSFCLANYDKTFILSAKHHVVQLTDILEPYELTLNKMSKQERISWTNEVMKQLSTLTDINNDTFYFHAGLKYREFLIPLLKNTIIPLESVSFGNQLKFYSNSSTNSPLF